MIGKGLYVFFLDVQIIIYHVIANWPGCANSSLWGNHKEVKITVTLVFHKRWVNNCTWGWVVDISVALNKNSIVSDFINQTNHQPRQISWLIRLYQLCNIRYLLLDDLMSHWFSTTAISVDKNLLRKDSMITFLIFFQSLLNKRSNIFCPLFRNEIFSIILSETLASSW